jgi:hypothetical protein
VETLLLYGKNIFGEKPLFHSEEKKYSGKNPSSLPFSYVGEILPL